MDAVHDTQLCVVPHQRVMFERERRVVVAPVIVGFAVAQVGMMDHGEEANDAGQWALPVGFARW